MWTATALFVLLLQSPDSEHNRTLDLAAVRFRAGDYNEARDHLHRALRINREDPYANNFLATLYLLQDNVEAALKYWNRIGKPRVDNVSTDPPVSINPVLWDRSFAFSPASTLTLEDFRNTKARLEFLDVLSRVRFDLVPAGDGFDVVVRPLLRTGTNGNGRLSTVAALARGVPYQTVEYDFRNVRSAGLNISTLLRWDPGKQRTSFRAAAPIQRNPQRRFDVSADVRHEAWDLAGDEFTINKVKVSAGVQSQVNERWSWGSRINASNRRSGKPGDRNGRLVTYEANVDHRLASLPERSLTMDLGASFEFGRHFTRTTSRTLLRWFPKAASDNYKATVIFQFGKVSGVAPFDEHFTLGLDRDHELLLRGHPATRDGRKGEGPIGTGFLLWNVDLQKNVLKQGLFTVGAGPFLDIARVAGTEQQFIDAGIQIRLSLVSGITLDFSYGRDLRAGRSAFFYR